MFLAYAANRGFRVYRIDIKSAFLNGELKEVYIEQPPRFKDNLNRDKVCKLKHALYELKQTSRAWYDTLLEFLMKLGFNKGVIDRTLFKIQDGDQSLLVQIYIDANIFGSTNKSLYKKKSFSRLK